MDEVKVKLIEIADRFARANVKTDALSDYLRRFRVIYRHLWMSVNATVTPGEANPLLVMTDEEISSLESGR